MNFLVVPAYGASLYRDKTHSPWPWHSLQTTSRFRSIYIALPLQATQTISIPLKDSAYRTIERVPLLDGELCNGFTWLATKKFNN